MDAIEVRIIRISSQFRSVKSKIESVDCGLCNRGPKQQAAFDTAKKVIARHVILAYPDFSKPFQNVSGWSGE